MNDLKGRLEQAGIANAAEFRPNLTHTEKQRFLRELTVLSVPTRSGEAFGLFVIEALASGVPVVQPDTGAFPELIELTGGGILHAPGDAGSLADALERLLLDPALCRPTRPLSAVKSSLRTSPAMRWRAILINCCSSYEESLSKPLHCCSPSPS